MDKAKCDEVRGALVDGLRDEDVTAHLDRCGDCRREAAQIEPLLTTLAAGAEIDPPPRVDRLVRHALRGLPAGVVHPFARPEMALALAAAALLALLAGISAGLAEAGAAEHGPAFAVWCVVSYLVVCSVAAVPLLLKHGRRLPGGLGGAKS